MYNAVKQFGSTPTLVPASTETEIMARLDIRLDGVLTRLARQYAPQSVPPNGISAAPGDLAATLAAHNLLVMLGTPSGGDDPETAVARWAQSYVTLYDLLTRRLFPSFTRVSAFYADGETPPIVVIQGVATPVIVALACYVVPYVAARQTTTPSDLELFGLTDLLLEALEAGDLPRDEYRRLRDNGAAQLRRILASKVRQRVLAPPHPTLAATFDLPLSDDLADLRTDIGPPAPPESLPETPSESPFGPSIPVFFDRKTRGRRPPPVPGLPRK